MLVFTVTKPGGTKDREFESYTQLLQDAGIDVSDVPRTPEPDTNRRWLYTWRKKEEAERFATELRRRTGDGSWRVHPFDEKSQSRGPVAPLDIHRTQTAEDATYYLTPWSRERVIASHPETRLVASISLTAEKQRALQVRHGEGWWDEVSKLLTGLTGEQIRALGGYRIVQPDGTVSYEELPEVKVG